MSTQLKEKQNGYVKKNHSDEVRHQENFNSSNKKVNLNDLMERMNESKKQEKKNNYLLSAAAISAVAVFGIILTL